MANLTRRSTLTLKVAPSFGRSAYPAQLSTWAVNSLRSAIDSRSWLAALDTGTGNATAWRPEPNESVTAIAVSGSSVYVGGSFTSVNTEFGFGGVPQRASQRWKRYRQSDILEPRTKRSERIPEVAALSISGTTMYVAGYFTSIGGSSRTALAAALDTTTGSATSWDPEPSAGGFYTPSVSAVTVSGSTVYVAGNFLSVGGAARYGVAALDANTGTATSWAAEPTGGGSPDAVAVSEGVIYIGGNFNSLGHSFPAPSRLDLAAVETASGAVTEWNPEDDAGDQLAVS